MHVCPPAPPLPPISGDGDLGCVFTGRRSTRKNPPGKKAKVRANFREKVRVNAVFLLGIFSRPGTLGGFKPGAS